VKCPVVFTTAYSEYALKAFKVNSIDYLLKPIKRHELEFALNKFKNLQSQYQPKTGKDLLTLFRSLYSGQIASYKRSLLIRKFDGFIPVKTDDIACLYIDNGIVYCQLFDNKSYDVSENLNSLEEELDPETFFRINRQVLVARNAIREISNYFGGRLLIKSQVDMKEKLLVSKGRVANFKRWVQGIH